MEGESGSTLVVGQGKGGNEEEIKEARGEELGMLVHHCLISEDIYN
jgi:hypothetical protein